MAGGTLQNQQNAIQQLTGLQRYNPMQTPTSSGQGAFNYQRPTQQTYQPYLTGTFASRNPNYTPQSQQSPLAYIYQMLYGGPGSPYGGPGSPSGTPGVDAGMDAPNAGSGVSASDAPGSAPGGTDGVGGPGSPGGW